MEAVWGAVIGAYALIVTLAITTLNHFRHKLNTVEERLNQIADDVAYLRGKADGRQ